MNTHAWSEDQLVEQHAVGRLSSTLALFESLQALRRKRMFFRYFLFEWKTSE